MLPLYFSSLNFSKPHLLPPVLLGFFQARGPETRSSGNTFCH
jgi:hypothetical protein